MSIGATKPFKREFSVKQEVVFRERPAQNNNKKIDLDKFERSSQISENLYDRGKARKIKNKDRKNEEVDTPSTPPASTPPKVEEPIASNPETTPIKVEPVKPSESDSSNLSYAQKYVAIYEKNSGNTLSPEERAAKVQDVAQFYSDPARANRLETLVDGLSASS